MGDLTIGATVFDRRRVPAARHNMDVAMDMDVAGVLRELIGVLTAAGRTAGPVEP